mgnify:CR=1 FL=1
MPRSYSISFNPAPAPIKEPVTKFGGQPVWKQTPTWPISVRTGEQMMFICQILLYPELFGQTVGRMAYLFMTDIERGLAATWDPDAGENAVIVHPGREPRVATKPLANGPSIYEYIQVPGLEELQPRPVEFGVDVFRRSDPDFVDEAHRIGMEDASFQRYEKECEGNKVGGTPLFLQEDALPQGAQLLLQVDSTKVPFYLNFGDCGVGWAFLSPDGSAGKFLFQSY